MLTSDYFQSVTGDPGKRSYEGLWAYVPEHAGATQVTPESAPASASRNIVLNRTSMPCEQNGTDIAGLHLLCGYLQKGERELSSRMSHL